MPPVCQWRLRCRPPRRCCLLAPRAWFALLFDRSRLSLRRPDPQRQNWHRLAVSLTHRGRHSSTTAHTSGAQRIGGTERTRHTQGREANAGAQRGDHAAPTTRRKNRSPASLKRDGWMKLREQWMHGHSYHQPAAVSVIYRSGCVCDSRSCYGWCGGLRCF